MKSVSNKQITYLLLAIVLIAGFCIGIGGRESIAAGTTVTWGSSGDAVREVQTRLKSWGYLEGKADGVYGNKTYEAIKKFQKSNGLPADGIVGKKTFEALGLGKYATSTAPDNNKTDSNKPSGGAVSNSDEALLLAKAIFAEAEGEPYVGKVAVGAVLLNRVASPDFPNTLSGVIYQGKALESISNGRFDKSSNNPDCIRAAHEALNGSDPSYGSLYFWNPSKAVNPWIWTRQIIVQYGAHVFGI